MHRGRGACGRSGKVGEIPGKPGKCGSVGAKEVACDKEVGLHASGISCATRNPTRLAIRRSWGPWARGSLVELWCWRPQNRGLRYEQEVRNWKERYNLHGHQDGP